MMFEELISLAFKQLLLGYLFEFNAHGYKIMKKVHQDFYPADPEINEGLLYTTLKRLEAEGLITRETETEDRPSRKVIHLTEAGRQQFLDWLMAAEDEDGVKFDFFYQYPFLERCNYFKYLDTEQVELLINKQIALSGQRLERYRAARESMIQKGVDRFRLAIIDYGISSEEMKIEWLKTLSERSAAGC